VNAETWIAVIAALIAGAALYFNARSTRAALRAARAAEEQTKVQQQLRVDAAQPYVWVDVRPDETSGTLLNLVVGNSGPTVATNIRMEVDPPLPSIDQLKVRAEAAQARLAEGIHSLAPGRSLTWPLGQGFNLLEDEGPQAYTFTVTADGAFGPVPPMTYVVDMSDWRGMLHRPAGSLHELTREVRELTKAINKA
jgi:type II secretory pathway pseudopilin PulG